MKKKYKFELNSFAIATRCPKYYDTGICVGSLACQECEWFKRVNRKKQFVICKIK